MENSFLKFLALFANHVIEKDIQHCVIILGTPSHTTVLDYNVTDNFYYDAEDALLSINPDIGDKNGQTR